MLLLGQRGTWFGDSVAGRGFDSIRQGVEGGSQEHPEGLRDLHQRQDLRLEGQGRVQRTRVGPVPVRSQSSQRGKLVLNRCVGSMAIV